MAIIKILNIVCSCILAYYLIYYIIPVAIAVVRVITNKEFLSYIEYFTWYVKDSEGELNVLIEKFKEAIASVGEVAVESGTKSTVRGLVKLNPEKQESCINVMHELLNSIK